MWCDRFLVSEFNKLDRSMDWLTNVNRFFSSFELKVEGIVSKRFTKDTLCIWMLSKRLISLKCASRMKNLISNRLERTVLLPYLEC